MMVSVVQKEWGISLFSSCDDVFVAVLYHWAIRSAKAARCDMLLVYSIVGQHEGRCPSQKPGRGGEREGRRGGCRGSLLGFSHSVSR